MKNMWMLTEVYHIIWYDSYDMFDKTCLPEKIQKRKKYTELWSGFSIQKSNPVGCWSQNVDMSYHSGAKPGSISGNQIQTTIHSYLFCGK